MSEKISGTITKHIFGESLELHQDEIYPSTPSKNVTLLPHPPEEPKDSKKSVHRVKRGKRSSRQGHSYTTNDDIDDDRRFSNQTTGSKLPPISNVVGNEIIDYSDNEPDTIDLYKPDKNIKHLRSFNTLKRKPLSPIKDSAKIVDDFKAKQSIERRSYKKQHPIKPFLKIKKTDNEGDKNTGNTINSDEETSEESEDYKHEKSEKTFTSVSSNSSSSDDGSDCQSNDRKNVSINPSLRGGHHRSLASLNSQKDNPEPTDHHSDTEALRRGRTVGQHSSKELWSKAKVSKAVSLLPRVLASKARDRNSNFVQDELEKYLPQYKLMVFVGTWNMHGEKQLPLFLEDLLLPECSEYMQDLYVIGSQESTPLRKEWEIKLQETLGPSHVLIYSSTFGVLHLALYLRRELVWFCSAVEQATVATRPGHMIKTKGAIGLSLSIFGTSFLFINSHLTAHEPKLKERISDYRLIRRSLSLPLNYSEKPTSKVIDVTSRFNQVFWFGDFNFRVSERHSVVMKYLTQCEDNNELSYDELLEKDQMTTLMKKNGVFENFKEATISFPPTYRFDINPDDPGHYSSKRVPSWTDRIVYRSKKENGICPIYYNCCPSINISDHRPVYGIFEANIEPIKERISFTGVLFARDVYIEANRRRIAPLRNQQQTAVCTIL